MVSRDGDLTKAQEQWIRARITSDRHQNLSEGLRAGFACWNVTQQGGLRSDVSSRVPDADGIIGRLYKSRSAAV